jgi:hypothetical protein
MAATNFTWSSFFLRFVFALLLVFVTYNPSGYSFFHWAQDALLGDSFSLTPPFAMTAVVLLIGWTIYIRATLRSLGGFGLGLACAFFAIIIWWLIDLGLIGLDSVSVFTYLILFILAAILATGMSWSHIRRKLSGQTDVDDVEE